MIKPQAIFLMMILLMATSFSALAKVPQYRQFEMEWEQVEGASLYEIEIKSKESQKTESKEKITKSIWTGNLVPGRYLYRLRAYDLRKVPGAWSDFEELEVPLLTTTLISPVKAKKIKSKSPEEEEIEFVWSSVPMAESYHLEVRALPMPSDENSEKVFKLSTQSNKAKIELPVGRSYSWTVVAENKTVNLFSEKTQVSEFTLEGPKLKKAIMQRPENGFVREITWKPDPSARSHDIKVFRRAVDNKKWELVQRNEVKSNQLTIPSEWVGGTYQIQVQGLSPYHESSDVAAINFNLHAGDRSPAAEFRAELRRSIEGLSGWYGIASYMITQVNYSSRYIENSDGAVTQFQTMAGTGRLGAGFFGEATPWGFLGILDLSGMTNQQGQNITFASTEALAIYRTQISTRDEVRLRMGIYMKELPYALPNMSTGVVEDYATLKNLGLTSGAEYWFSMTPKLGLQAHTYLYLNLGGPTGFSPSQIKPGLSQQYGVMGSYRLSSNQTGLAGVTYRTDSYRFDPERSNFGDVENYVDLRGLYINFYLEHEF